MGTSEICGACEAGYHEACRGRHQPCACHATHLCGSEPPADDPQPTADELLATVAECERRRLELLAELKRNGERHGAAVAALVAAVGQGEAAARLGVSRQQVWRLARGH